MDCPRCEKAEATKIFEAPQDGAWELYRCPHCYFIWRSTEEEYIRNRELYNPDFKLNDEKIKGMIDKPPIPALRK